MKRRNFLAMIPILALAACQGGWPFKPKSKPPPIERYEPISVKGIVELDRNFCMKAGIEEVREVFFTELDACYDLMEEEFFKEYIKLMKV